MPDQPAGSPRRRTAVEPGAMTSALFQSFTQASPAPAEVAAEAPAAPADSPAVASPAPTAAGAGQGAVLADPADSPARPTPRGTVDQAARPAPPRAARSAGLTRRPAPAADVDAPARPGRPGRPRLVEPTAYATKHRAVKVARVQTLLREGDLDVLDELARLTLAATGEDSNRSELLRALVEAVDASGIAEELAGCGTHRQRVAFLADRLRGSE